MFDLSGRVALVTGGNGGIGLGFARGLAKAGASVMVAGRNAAKNEAAVAELAALGAQAGSVEVDVTEEASIRAMVATTAERFGPARHPGEQCRDQHPQPPRGGTRWRTGTR